MRDRKKGDVEANINKIKKILGKLPGIMGVRKYDGANNDSSYEMSERRGYVLGRLCEDICRVEGALS